MITKSLYHLKYSSIQRMSCLKNNFKNYSLFVNGFFCDYKFSNNQTLDYPHTFGKIRVPSKPDNRITTVV